MLTVALNYLSSGLSVLPAYKQSKRPAIGSWSLYQERLPMKSEIERFFGGSPDGICLICGKVSGNLEVIDFDCGGELFPAWAKLIPLELGKKLVIETTQSGGYHVFYRCTEAVDGNTKLALGTREGKKVTLIETRGEGGLVLCAPGNGYTLKRGVLTAIPTLTPAERSTLLLAAKSLDEAHIQEDKCKTYAAGATGSTRPGDEYNYRGDVIALLEKHHWRICNKRGDELHFTRPGKAHGTSATMRDRVFYVFSSNAEPFEMNTAYSPFHVYALLEHQGDFSRAAQALGGESHAQIQQSIQETPPVEKKELLPWQMVNNQDIKNILNGTLLGRMATLYGSATTPELPLEAALVKALVTAGCALSQPLPAGECDPSRRGADLAQLKINTAGGQVCNVYALLVGNPASGKDIGNLLEHTAGHFNWMLGTGGTAEGVMDSLMETPNGIQVISELRNYLDPKHYCSKTADVYTELFSKGFFKQTMSKKGESHTRESNYAFPNLYANIQPEIFTRNVRQEHLDSGFLSRFLMVRMPLFFGRPSTADLQPVKDELLEIAQAFRNKSGTVKVPENYLGECTELFAAKAPEHLMAQWRRLINEYSPRFAVMLSLTGDPMTWKNQVTLDERCWEGAKTLVYWFFNHAANLLGSVAQDTNASTREAVIRKILKVIIRAGKNGITWGQISQRASYGTTRMERFSALSEMLDRQWIRAEGERQLFHNGKILNIAEHYFPHLAPSY